MQGEPLMDDSLLRKALGYRRPASSSARFRADLVEPERAARLGAPLTFVGHSWWHKAWEEPAAAVRERAGRLRQRFPLSRERVRSGLGPLVSAAQGPGAD